ncbi:hypothetical protein DB88DRAFT_345650 [Papiliotrema laurentii]|uniref:Uncharacterized protein n=1 Tax=Papiliotrema laurentii TaxID=5418 RepID=A0AAD9FL46_PAPLA|nr:hypothetical protein DB88DRAFT_345650 [Papiliotrema laurentii]
MSLRQTLFKQSAAVARSRAIPASRALSSTSPRKGGHDDHHSSGPDDTETHESWFSAPWRNTFILTAIGIAAFPFLPSATSTPASPALSPEEFNRLKSDPSTPWITRKLAGLLEDEKDLRARNDKHVDESMRSAETRLLFETAERPEVNKIKNRYTFDQASPYGVPVGSSTDVSEVRSL